jgi:ABC-type branched-subunit amino acid transport system substrate-binding protein
MSKRFVPVVAVLLCFAIAAAACSSESTSSGPGANPAATTKPIDYKAIGLWNDGPCDTAKPPLTIGLMTVFESPVLSLKDQATALEASATAFNSRGGANGSCIKVVTCDDGGNLDQAVGCVRTVDSAGVVATVNDQGTAGQKEVSDAMAAAKIPRVASNVAQDDWGDQNAYPLDASGTGVTFLLPQALIDANVHEIGLVRVDFAAASALKGLLADAYKGKATFPVDIPVPAGTTDFSQFILSAQQGGANGIAIALGEQEATQLAKAGQQLNTKLRLGSSLGTFSQATIADLGQFADQMNFLWSFPPATFDLPVYDALRSDLAASGDDALQPANLKASPMRSWIGLYALLWMIRDAKMTNFTREGITKMLDSAKDVPMLNIFGGENWTPDTDHPGIFKRAGTNHWATWKWDSNAPSPAGLPQGNFVKVSDLSFDTVLCGTIFGAPAPC